MFFKTSPKLLKAFIGLFMGLLNYFIHNHFGFGFFTLIPFLICYFLTILISNFSNDFNLVDHMVLNPSVWFTIGWIISIQLYFP